MTHSESALDDNYSSLVCIDVRDCRASRPEDWSLHLELCKFDSSYWQSSVFLSDSIWMCVQTYDRRQTRSCRMQDRDMILAHIADVEAFNLQLQLAIFGTEGCLSLGTVWEGVLPKCFLGSIHELTRLPWSPKSSKNGGFWFLWIMMKGTLEAWWVDPGYIGE